MPTDSGFSSQKMRGPSRHQTIQTLGSDRVGVAAAQMYLYEKTTVAIGITVVAKQDPDGKILAITFDGNHNAKKFDVMRILDNILEGWEFEVIKRVSATVIHVYNIGDLEGVEQLPVVGDTVKLLRWTTALSDPSGALQVSQGPTQFTRNGATQTVIEDTAVPANNKPLPAGMYILKDGVVYPVGIDTAVPANTVMVPVQISGASGPINITAGDLNVQLSDVGVNYDATRIGDGKTLLAIEAVTGKALVKDEDVANFLSNIDGYTANLQQTVSADGGVLPPSAILMGGKNGAVFKGLSMGPAGEANVIVTSAALPTGAATEAKQDTLIAKDFATQTTLAALLVELALKADLTETQPVSAAALPLPTGASTEAKQDTLIAKDFATQTTLAALLVELALKADLTETQPVSLAALPIMVPTYQEIVNLTNVVQTFTAPVGAKWAKVMADDANTVNIRVKIGAAATSVSGMQFQPGRSEDYSAVGDISVIAESAMANQKIYVQFGV